MGTPQPPHPNQHLLTYTWWDVSPKKGTSQSLAPTVVGHRSGDPLIKLGPGGCPVGSELAGAGGGRFLLIWTRFQEEGGRTGVPA